MTRHYDQDWSDYTCPHCGENVWDTDYSHDDSYTEDEWFVEEVTCGCGAELTFSRRIADYPSYVSWSEPADDNRDNSSEILRQTSQRMESEIERILASPVPVPYIGPNCRRVNPEIVKAQAKDESKQVYKSMVAAWNALHSGVTAAPPQYILQNGTIMHASLADIDRRIAELAIHSPA